MIIPKLMQKNYPEDDKKIYPEDDKKIYPKDDKKKYHKNDNYYPENAKKKSVNDYPEIDAKKLSQR